MARETTWEETLRALTGRINSRSRHIALEVTLAEMKGLSTQTKSAIPLTEVADILSRVRDEFIARMEKEFPL